MKYVLLVSHGTFAYGMQSVLEMLAGGKRDDVLSVCLEDGMSADAFAEKVTAATEVLTDGDEVIILGDILGGSPMTNAASIITEKGFAANTICIGGMNLGMTLTAVMMKDMSELSELTECLMTEAKNAIKDFPLASDDAEDEDDDI